MNRTVLLAVSALLLSTPVAVGDDYTVGGIAVSHPYARATPASAAVGGGYMMLENRGAQADRLLSVASGAAQRVEVHEMAMANGVMTMRPVKDGVALPAGAKVELKPGGFHVMFIGLAKPFVKGERVKATLTFEKAGPVDVEFAVEALGGSAPAHGDAHAH